MTKNTKLRSFGIFFKNGPCTMPNQHAIKCAHKKNFADSWPVEGGEGDYAIRPVYLGNYTI